MQIPVKVAQFSMTVNNGLKTVKKVLHGQVPTRPRKRRRCL